MTSVERALLAPDEALFDELAEEAPARAPLRLLCEAAARGRLAHALLLAGPTGSGRWHCAVRLAQSLACEEGLDACARRGGPCLGCAPCERIARGLDPSVELLEPPVDPGTGRRRADIGIEQVRKLQERLGLRGTTPRRVVIVRPADLLSPVAQEAVLKTLEEPPAGVHLALVTARPDALKPTVRSRCQLVRFAPPSREALEAVLRGRGASAHEARAAAALSRGDARLALAMDAAEASEQWLDLARGSYEVLGARGESRARDLAVALAGPKGGGAAGRDALARRLDLLEGILRDALVAGTDPGGAGGELAARLVHPGGLKAARALSERLPPGAAARALEEVARARDDLELRMNPRTVLTALFLALHGLRRARS